MAKRQQPRAAIWVPLDEIEVARDRLQHSLQGTGLFLVGKAVIEQFGENNRLVRLSWKVFSGQYENHEEGTP